jgi:acyl-CoA synthetase (AMP-forming)/AMP-acid ligase II
VQEGSSVSHLLTVSDAIAAHARLQPGKLGARDSRRSLSYAAWDERATRLANGLLGLGLRQGDRVALLAYNCVEWMEIYAAIARAGLMAVPINFRLAGPEIAYIVAHSEARAMIVQEDLRDRVEAIRAGLPIDERGLIHFGGPTPAGWQGYEALIGAAPAATPAVSVKPEDPFALMYTSGTTGRPKGAIRSHEGNALIALATALEFGLSRDDTGLLVMPLCHANSLYFALTFISAPASSSTTTRASTPKRCSARWRGRRSRSRRSCRRTTS